MNKSMKNSSRRHIKMYHQGLHPHRRQSTQVSWTVGKNPVSARMKKLLSIFN